MRCAILAVVLCAGCDSPKPVTTAARAEPRLAPKTVPLPKKEPARPPLVEPVFPPDPPKPPTFDQVWAELPVLVATYRRETGEEYATRSRLLTPDEQEVVDRIRNRKDDTRSGFTAGELELMRERGFRKWLLGNTLCWALADPGFKTAAEWVWERSPGVRSRTALVALAAKWGERDESFNLALMAAMRAVETNGRELTKGERDIVVEFAGEEYYVNRP